jgi:hypothetical protein
LKDKRLDECSRERAGCYWLKQPFTDFLFDALDKIFNGLGTFVTGFPASYRNLP